MTVPQYLARRRVALVPHVRPDLVVAGYPVRRGHAVGVAARGALVPDAVAVGAVRPRESAGAEVGRRIGGVDELLALSKHLR